MARQQAGPPPPSLPASACYVYGIVPSWAHPDSVDDVHREVALVPHRRIGALVHAVPARPVRPGRRGLVEHAHVLDRMAGTTPVLPMRFGTVAASREAVEGELLAPHHDRFAAVLEELTGRAQFIVRARYVTERIMREVLAEEPQVLRLHRRLGRQDARSDHARRIRLGELVASAVAIRREADATALTEALRPHAVSTRVRVSQATDLDSLADAAFIVEVRHRARFEGAAESLGRQWQGRVRLRLLGPMAAYHFLDDLVAGLAGGR